MKYIKTYENINQIYKKKFNEWHINDIDNLMYNICHYFDHMIWIWSDTSINENFIECLWDGGDELEAANSKKEKTEYWKTQIHNLGVNEYENIYLIFTFYQETNNKNYNILDPKNMSKIIKSIENMNLKYISHNTNPDESYTTPVLKIIFEISFEYLFELNQMFNMQKKFNV